MMRRVVLVLVVLALAAAGVFYWQRRSAGLPRQGSPAYEATTRAFYSGLAALEVGLLDNAVTDFTAATTTAPREPAAWANLGVARLRLSDLEAADAPVQEALRLAPDSPDVQVLAARMLVARGRVDEGLDHLRRAVTLAPSSVRIRYALAEELERSGSAENATEAMTLLDAVASDAPRNSAVQLERARLAAARGDSARLQASLRNLTMLSGAWAPLAREQEQALVAASQGPDLTAAARAVVLLRNVLAREPSFTSDLAAVRTQPELVTEAFERFVALPSPVATPAPPDTGLHFDVRDQSARRATTATAFSLDGTRPPVVFAADATSLWRTDRSDRSLPFPGTTEFPAGSAAVVPLDWNNDFATDVLVVGQSGVRLFLQREGEFVDATASAAGAAQTVNGLALRNCGCRAAWPADIEMDGDLDAIIGVRNDATRVLRNNGDGTWTPLDVFARARDVRAFAWADVDGDGDPDAVFLAGDAVRVYLNNRAGSFTELTQPVASGATAMTIADLDADGRFDIVSSGADGALRRSTMNAAGAWDTSELAPPGSGDRAATIIFAADLDNNGALDLVTSGANTLVWLADERFRLQQLPTHLEASVSQAIDLDGDGHLDLVGVRETVQPFMGRGVKPYHWKDVRVRGQAVAGDQRINPFAVGGEIEVRSGLLRQRQLLTGNPAHFGLGTRESIDVARIVWPNGAPQVEFTLNADNAITAEQRLKGSCPWVFAYDGTGMRFVTDFIWRSPLGLRINAQDTAGINQTEDWVRIRADQLMPRDGHYDVRITAELWETHFFDHVSLMTVDHPTDTDVFVDERFARTPVAFAAQPVRDLRAVQHAVDDDGTDVTAIVATRDGQHLATFARGHYQGIATEHAVAFDLPARDGQARPQGDERLVLVAQGWVYPTDSSINVAVAQGSRERPHGIALDYQSADGRWITAEPDLGFPAGKNKTMLIDLGKVGNATRVRLRTNMEVYWDALRTGVATRTPVKTERLAAATADLRYRGFSRTTSVRDMKPETPIYAPIAAAGPRWRDLVGYYTRFGDVRELIAGVDDRYVIMNAGDELAMTFPVPPAPPTGWVRDFVLIGDGWEKDGDFNTEFSATVLPLPTHAATKSAPPSDLEHDPVYLAHPSDWERYHTRHVRPDAFARGLAP
jgi:tetratricopeptide (TPR) repeat protein